MSEDSRAGRMAVRFSNEDKAWLAEQAEDEGVEPATLVRLIVNRLRRGRPLLMSMVMPAPQAEVIPGLYQPSSQPIGEDVVNDVLSSRLTELETISADVVRLHAEPDGEAVAMPLRRVPRQQYNPGRN